MRERLYPLQYLLIVLVTACVTYIHVGGIRLTPAPSIRLFSAAALLKTKLQAAPLFAEDVFPNSCNVFKSDGEIDLYAEATEDSSWKAVFVNHISAKYKLLNNIEVIRNSRLDQRFIHVRVNFTPFTKKFTITPFVGYVKASQVMPLASSINSKACKALGLGWDAASGGHWVKIPFS